MIGSSGNFSTQPLNPQHCTPFDYKVITIHSDSINAVSFPAGLILIYSSMFNQLATSIESGQIKESKVTFADGSTATVDLSGVTLNDALAALIGHELTHVASRHSLASLSLNMIIAHLAANIFPNTPLWGEWGLDTLLMLRQSRRNEYEADATGAYFAQKAGYNILGILYLQEFLRRTSLGGATDLYIEHFSYYLTHPFSEHRKRAVFAAINVLDPNSLKNNKIELAEDNYDPKWASDAHLYARRKLVS